MQQAKALLSPYSPMLKPSAAKRQVSWGRSQKRQEIPRLIGRIVARLPRPYVPQTDFASSIDSG